MKAPIRSTAKFILFSFAIIGVIWFSPDQLYSQAAPRSTTSLPPSVPQAAPTTQPQPGQPSAPTAPTRPGQQAAPQPPTAEELLKVPYTTRPSMITQAATLTLFSLLPFIIMILTSFLKIVVVLSLLRSALGVQQSPPNQIINGVAFMLSLFVMYPTGLKMYDSAQNVVKRVKAPESLVSAESSAYIIAIADEAKEPLRDFLKKNSSVKHQALFYRISYRVLPEEYRPGLKPDDFMILVPAFITSQLKDAFEIGVLIYIPFFVIDLVTSNILLAMGMMMLSPVTISMPLKLFLLVMLDGWTLLIEGLINTFR